MDNRSIEWIGKFPDNWNLIRIKNILKERNEKNNPVKTEKILSLTASQGVIPYSEKEGGGNKPKDNITDYKLAYIGDIVMNSMNVLSGSVGLSQYFGCVSPVYYILNSKTEEFNIEFINYIFQTSAFQKSLLGLGNGIMMKESGNGKLNTIRMRIPLEKIYNLYLAIPNLKKQNKIVDFLNDKVKKIDNMLKNINLVIDEYKNYKKSLIIEKVTHGLNKQVDLSDCELDWIDKYPSHWDITLARNILKKLNRKVEENSEMLVYSNSGKVIKKSESKTGLVTDNEDKLQGVKEGDLLIHGMDTWHGAIAISDMNGKCTPVVHVCKTNKCKEYIMYYLQSLAFRNVYKKITNGVRENTSDFRSWEKVGTIPIIVPPLSEQREIADYLNRYLAEIDNIIEEKEKMIVELEKYKSNYIYEYVTGKKEVK